METIELVPGLLNMFRFSAGQAYLWRDPGSLTLIDAGPPGNGADVAAALGRLGLGVSDLHRVILTHFHGDHVGSASDVASWGRATVMAHRSDAPVIRGSMPGLPPALTEEERPLHARIVAAASYTDATAGDAAGGESYGLARVPACRVDRELSDGDLIDFGGGAAVIGVPGHTDGSIAIHLPAHRLLLTGDSVARTPDGRVILGPFNVDRKEAIASFRKLAEFDVDVACFGHGDPLLSDAAPALRTAAQQESFGLASLATAR